VRDVGMSHEVVVTADARGPVAGDVRSAVDGNMLPKGIEVADLGACRFALVPQVLRVRADDAAGTNSVSRPNDERANEVDVRADFAVGTDRDRPVHDRVRSNANPRRDGRLGRNYGGGMDLRHVSS